MGITADGMTRAGMTCASPLIVKLYELPPGTLDEVSKAPVSIVRFLHNFPVASIATVCPARIQTLSDAVGAPAGVVFQPEPSHCFQFVLSVPQLPVPPNQNLLLLEKIKALEEK